MSDPRYGEEKVYNRYMGEHSQSQRHLEEWTSSDGAGNGVGKERGEKGTRYCSQEAKFQIEWVTKMSELCRNELLREGQPSP